MNPTRTLVFAKAPVPGRVKTRLIPALGTAGAADLARRMLDHALEQALEADIGPVELCASPALSAPDWAGFTLPPGVAHSDQGEGDLGARMARAALRHLDHDGRVLLIGSDCPALSARHLREAAAALDCHDAVIHPALDGGYPLLGLRAFHPSLFTDMPWSTPAVAELTLVRMQALEWCVWVGETLADIDEPADLAHLPEHLGLETLFHTQGDKS
ncbi:MAG: hypothetical protein AUJ86_03710 [Hydrogenophilaceae bacterium CG1_02_62_390]|nr:MAG: hypothetical protein AUJ86_03710 [Hydrogenophilaceae bacterium CG1_02_62_390]PIW38044.1 MAG: hypothetical protein COW23_08590 [Hydrogenophilales bacterium CG15_BIG_FIL_POST_REV_8_21_14_020_62_31]PIX02351.1 MAG: hypothetical protein COZ79_02185 [Hydrogenophilales bacterium CG_4_8_14_3_um_filter_62_83]